VTVEQMYEVSGRPRHARRGALDAAIARLPEGVRQVGDDLGPGREAIMLPEPLGQLLPRGVRRGEAIAVREDGGDGPGFLSLMIVAAALAQGQWCAAVAVAGLGGLALAESLKAQNASAGALQRLLVVSDPGQLWAEVAVLLADGVDLVLFQPPETVPAALTRRISARVRQGAQSAAHRAALVALGPWPGADMQLSVKRNGWVGFGEGTGHLRAGRAVVTVEARTHRRRSVEAWLPAEGGGIALRTPRLGAAERARSAAA
jgi:hypothetical protein